MRLSGVSGLLCLFLCACGGSADESGYQRAVRAAAERSGEKVTAVSCSPHPFKGGDGCLVATASGATYTCVAASRDGRRFEASCLRTNP